MKNVWRKTANGILTLLGLATLLFIILMALPSDPARMMMDQRQTEETLTAIRKKYAFDRPVIVQYAYYLNDLSPLSINSRNPDDFTYPVGKYGYLTLARLGDMDFILKWPYLRESFQKNGQKVSDIIASTLPNTLILAVPAILLALLLGIFLGILAAVYKNTWIDRSITVLGSFGVSLPSFFMAILMAWLFAFLLHSYTGLPLSGNLYRTDPLGRGRILNLAAMVLPMITLAIRPLAIIIQLTRNSMLGVLNADYIRTARAKGLKQKTIIVRHALPGALNPVITAVSGWFAGMLAGSMFVEIVFGWNGLGKTIVGALDNMDLPVVMGAILTISTLFIFINIATDYAYRLTDPRLR